MVTSGALKHGITEAVIRSVVAGPLRVVPQGARTLVIGVDGRRDLIEVVVDGDRAVHAMRLRPKNYALLRSERPPPVGDGHPIGGGVTT